MKPRADTVLFTAALLLAGCVVTPPRPDPELVRLQDERARLHADPQVTAYAASELRVADAAVDLLASEERRLDSRDFRHGAYLADRHLRIAEASAHARFEEQRTDELARERALLLARTAPPPRDEVAAPTASGYPPATYRAANDHHERLAAVQARLGGLESHLDHRGLVLTLPDYMFENGRGEPRAATQRALDTLAGAMRADTGTRLAVAGDGADALDARRAAAVRAYLATRGLDPARVNATYAAAPADPPPRGLRIVVRVDDPPYGLSER